MVRAPGCGPGGRGFDSHHPPHKKTGTRWGACFLMEWVVLVLNFQAPHHTKSFCPILRAWGRTPLALAMVAFSHQGVLPCSHAVRGGATSHHPPQKTKHPHSGVFFVFLGDVGAEPPRAAPFYGLNRTCRARRKNGDPLAVALSRRQDILPCSHAVRGGATSHHPPERKQSTPLAYLP